MGSVARARWWTRCGVSRTPWTRTEVCDHARDPYLVVERLAPDRDRLRGDDSRADGCGLEELGPMTGSEGEVTDLDARLWHLWLRG